MDFALMTLAGLEALSRETMMFAAIGFLIGGTDDLAVDFVYLARAGWRRRDECALPSLQDDPCPGRIAVFVPAWDEAAVIGAMLTATLDRYGAGDYRLYVGTYPNDRATIDRVAAVAECSWPKIRGQKFSGA